MTITLSEIQENLSFCETPEEQYSYIIDLGKQLAPYPDDKKDATHEIHGCSSTIWFTYTQDSTGKYHFLFSSDALIVRGLLFIVATIFDGLSPSEISTIDTQKIFTDLGLYTILSSQRQVGLSSVIKRIQEIDYSLPPKTQATSKS